GGERRERLEVHREAVGGALGPELRLLLGWQRVVRSVVLHEREASGVVAEALFRVVLDLLGIPAGCDERRVGPRARTHLHRSEGEGRSPPPTRRYPLPPTGTGPGRAPRPPAPPARGPTRPPRRRLPTPTGNPAGGRGRPGGPRARPHLRRSEGEGRSPPTTRPYPLPPTGTGPGRARRPSSLAARDPRRPPRRRVPERDVDERA